MNRLLFSVVISLLVCAGQAFAYDERTLTPPTDLLSLCYHDVTLTENLEDPMSVTVDTLIKQLT